MKKLSISTCLYPCLIAIQFVSFTLFLNLSSSQCLSAYFALIISFCQSMYIPSVNVSAFILPTSSNLFLSIGYSQRCTYRLGPCP